MRILLLGILFFFSNAYAESKIPSQISFSIGTISANFAENPDQLKPTDGTVAKPATPYSGTASVMPLDILYEYFPNLKYAYYFRLTGPLMGSSPDRYYSGSGGINFYFSKLGSPTQVSDYKFQLELTPKFRYYAGVGIGAGYLVYNTVSASKSDTQLEIGAQGGVIYTINSKWALRAEVGAARAVGVLVQSTVIKILLGTTYNLGL